ncbi:glycoside hydrolase family 3 C-terminal domain-containing protein [Streptomyces sp. NPDC005071]
MALGGASLWFNGERTEGEGIDSADISLPAAQARLAEAVAATGKLVLVVLVQGRSVLHRPDRWHARQGETCPLRSLPLPRYGAFVTHGHRRVAEFTAFPPS